MKPPTTVLVVMPLAEQRGGSELALQHLVERDRAFGVRWVVVFLESGPMVDTFRRLGVAAHVVPAGRMRQPASFVRAVGAIADLARREGAAAVLGWMGKGQIYGGLAARRAGVPALWFQHGLTLRPHWIDRVATAIPARGVFACSAAAAAAQARIRPRRAVRVVHPAVDLARFDPDRLPPPGAVRRALGLPERGVLFGMVGRLQRWKGMHVFVEAMARVREAVPDAVAVIVGGRHDLEPDYPGVLQAAVARHGLEDAVHLVGFQADVPRWMQAFDVFVHASDHEPFGMVVIEAMAMGKAVVAGDAAGPREILTDDSLGRLVAYGDVPALAEVLESLARDAALRARLGAAARRRAQCYGPERYAESLADGVRMFLRAAQDPEDPR